MKLPLLTLGLISFVSTISAQSVIYRETFSTSVNNVSLTGSAGWAAHSASAGTRHTDPTLYGLSNQVGRPTGLANVNSGDTDALNTGFAFIASGPNISTLLWTDEYTVDRSVFAVSSITFNMGNASTGSIARVAVEIGGAWYATDQTFQNTVTTSSAANFAANAQTMTFSFTSEATAWRALSFATPDPLTADTTAFSLGGTTLESILPTGDITAFGIYMTSQNTMRFDTFTIEATAAVPEPSTYAILAGLAVLGCGTLHRRRAA